MVLLNQKITGIKFYIMFRYIIFLFFSLFILANNVFSQCNIDYSYQPAGAANYGLSPDSLPNGIVGSFYSEDLTFFVPSDTLYQGINVTLTDIHITSISLPIGLSWQCNNYNNGCHYDPSVSNYGCVNISGTPIYPGNYNVEVSLIINHSFSSVAGPINIDFQISFNILPDTSTVSNNGFSMLGASSCNSTLVDFTNNNPGLMYYAWDFGNGNLSNSEHPLPQFYSGNDTSYIVNYSAWNDTNATYIYTLDQVGVINVFDDWDWGYLSTFGVCTGECNPDIFIEIYDNTTGNQVYYGNYYLDTWYPNYWAPNIVLDPNSTYTIDITEWDDGEALGVFGGNDNLGSIQFNVSSGTTLLNNNYVQSSITISSLVIPANPNIVSVDTVVILPTPLLPAVTYDSVTNILSTMSNAFSMQWYYNGSPIPNAVSNQISPIYSGDYYLIVFNQYGCSNSSDTLNIIVCSNNIVPDLIVNNNDVEVSNANFFISYSWFNIAGNLVYNTVDANVSFNISDNYYVVAVDSFGCTYYSDTVLICSDSQQPILSYNSNSQFFVVDSNNYVFYNWYFNNSQILNQNSGFLNATNSGYYHVESFDVFGCNYSSSSMLHCDQNYNPSVFNFEKLFWTSDTIGVINYQWYYNGAILPGENSPFLVPDNFSGGNYYVEVTDTLGCVYQSLILVASSIDENINDIISFYPNPTNDILYCDVQNDLKADIVDLSGNIIISVNFNFEQNHIDLSFLNKGVYVINYKFRDKDYSYKFLKL